MNFDFSLATVSPCRSARWHSNSKCENTSVSSNRFFTN